MGILLLVQCYAIEVISCLSIVNLRLGYLKLLSHQALLKEINIQASNLNLLKSSGYIK